MAAKRGLQFPTGWDGYLGRTDPYCEEESDQLHHPTVLDQVDLLLLR